MVIRKLFVPKKLINKSFTYHEVIDHILEKVVSEAKLWIHPNFPLPNF